jgi:PAS domain S-box-containing protein
MVTSGTRKGSWSRFSLDTTPPLASAPAAGARDERLGLQAVALGIAFLATAWLGQALAMPGSPIAAIWIPSGLQLAVLVLRPPRTWPAFVAAVAVADLAFNVTMHHPPTLAAAFIATNAAEAVAAAALIQRLVGVRPALETIRELLVLVGVAAAVSAVGAVFAASAVQAVHGAPWVAAWASWWGSSVGGIVVVAPLVVSLVAGRLHPRRRTGEAAALAALLACAATLVLLVPPGSPLTHKFLLFPPLVWAALRFGVRGVATAGLAIGLLMLLGASRGLGDLAPHGVAPAALGAHIQLFLVVVLATCHALAISAAQRERAVREARAAREQFDLFLRHSPVLVFLNEAESGRAVALSRGFEAFTGHTVEQMLGRRCDEFFPPELSARFRTSDAQVVAEGRALEFEDEVAGRRFVTVKFPLRREDGTLLIGGFATDVTDERQAEVAGRLASVGTLAAGIAHEINNPLAFVDANLSFSIDRLRAAAAAAPREVLPALVEAREGAQRMRDIVRDLQTFSRPSEERSAPADVREPLRAALNLARNELRHRAEVVLELGEAPAVLAAEHRLAQVFLNLLVNAAHAIPPNGASEHRITLRSGRAADGWAFVEVADSGCGIAPDVRPRIFEPFFTTKPGQGTGLGLSICHGIVVGLGGRIEVESEPGRGSVFRVLLPPATGDAAPAPPPPPAPPPAVRGRVLVVDDEALVGRAVARVLGAAHEVVCVTDPREALARVLAAEPFDLVLCDLMMPRMSGIELYEQVVAALPGLERRFVFMTGGAFTDGARDFLERTSCAQVAKPFEVAGLRDLVARLLAEEHAERAPGPR